jgi:hypothetical protein
MGTAVVLVSPYMSGPVTFIGTVLFGGAVWLTLSMLSGLLSPTQVKSALL